MSEDVAAPREDGAADGRAAPAAALPPVPAETKPSTPACAVEGAAANKVVPPPGLSTLPEAGESGAAPDTTTEPSAAPPTSAKIPIAAMPAAQQPASGSAASAPVAAPSSLGAPAVAAAAAARERTQLSADAQVFVSSEQAAQQAVHEATQQAVQQAYLDDANFVLSLPPAVRQQLRGCFQAPNGEIVSYYVGKLKSFNHRNGYGFIACAQARAAFGQDVFIHKNWMDHPWSIGQVVEFAVMPNNKGQPQAYDASWPKQLGTPNHPRPVVEARVGFSTAGVASTGGTGDGHGAAAGMQADPSSLAHMGARTAAATAVSTARRLGVLKSFSPAQGYGFIECDEVKQSHQRDTYLDKSQLPTNMLWRHGQVVEFSVCLNSRSQPQARDINWDPIPLLPTEAGAPSNASQGSHRNPTKPTVDKLRKLLDLLHKKQHEVAVLTAIDNQGHGAVSTQPAEATTEVGIDYVTFVLDRAGDAKEAVGIIKDFVKMLLLLMLARMLRTQQDQRRCQQLQRWFQALTESINPGAQGVREHFKSVVQQIKVHIDKAKDTNPVLRQEDVPVSSVDAAFSTLQRMAEDVTAGAEAAQAVPTTA